MAGVVWSAWPAPAGASAYIVVTERLVVQLSAAAQTHPASLLGSLPGAVPQRLPGRRWTTDLPVVEAGLVQGALTGSKGVEYVSPVEAVQSSAVEPSDVVPDDPCYSASCGPTTPVKVENPSAGPGATVVHPDGQSDLWAVNASQAWGITRGSPNVLVAVLDTGVDVSQAQLAGKVIVGPDVCADDRPLCASPGDNNGHGTFVAGLIAADTDDGIGMASLGWETRALDIKVLDDQGKGNTMDEATGIYDAVAAGARVINLSLTNEPCSMAATDCGPDPDSEAAVEYAIAHGVVVVSAAGNFDSTEPVYPASYPGVLSVAAGTDQALVDPSGGDAYLDFSEYGQAADIAAPGIDVLSTWNDGNYAVESGTSMAAPHVAAAGARGRPPGPAVRTAGDHHPAPDGVAPGRREQSHRRWFPQRRCRCPSGGIPRPPGHAGRLPAHRCRRERLQLWRDRCTGLAGRAPLGQAGGGRGRKEQRARLLAGRLRRWCVRLR
jgi:subtilisin family serine protease